MDSAANCPQCGRPLSPDAPGRLCLRCLAVLGASGPPRDPEATLILPPPAAAGTIRYFGDYELLEELGHGGMGVVYRARQVSLGRPVAVKMILHGHYASEEFLRRFRLEAETIAQLRHPHIVGIFEVGEHEGQPYFSMEYVPGMTLAERVRTGPLPPREAARCLVAVARAVQYAHDSGVLHRDLKPSNILLDERGQPRVTDFGVAKRIQAEAELTATGQTLGTPAYIPPEQIAVKRGAITVRSDVYSLGAVLYHLLTGRPPFQGSTPAEVFKAVLDDEPAAPRTHVPHLPHDLETICLRSLAKDPARRYASAAAFADDLERWIENKPIQARPVGARERLWLWAKRKPAVASLSGAMVVAILIGTAAVLRISGLAERYRLRADAATMTVRRSESLRAEGLFTNQLADQALAICAAMVRLSPHDQILASRLVSALTARDFVFPSAPALDDGSQTLWAGFSPRGDRVITWNQDNSVRWWDAATGQPSTPSITHEGGIEDLGFSADRQTLVVVGGDGALILRDPQNGALLDTLAVPGLTRTAGLSPDGSLVAAGLTNGVVLLLDRRQTPPARRELPAHEDPIQWIEFSRDGRFLVTAAGETNRSRARLWACESNFIRLAEFPQISLVAQASFSPDSRRLAIRANTNLGLWEVPTGRNLTNFAFEESVTAMAFSPDNVRLAFATREGLIHVLDAETGDVLFRRPVHKQAVYTLDFSPDGQHVASSSDDAKVLVWDVHSGDLVCEPITHLNSAVTAQFGLDGTRLVTATLHTAAHVWDLRPGAAAPRTLSAPDAVRFVAFTEAPTQLLTISARGGVHAWDPPTGALRRTLRLPGTLWCRGTFDDSRRRVALAQADGQAFVLDLNSTQSTRLAATFASQMVEMAFSPDGRRIAVAEGATNSVFDTATGRSLVPPLVCRGFDGSYAHETYTLAFSPDGRWLLTACYNQHARLWDLASGAVIGDFPHRGPVTTAEFTPDGQRFLTASFDNLARVWSVTNTAHPLLRLRHRDRPTGARLSPDGRRALTSTFGNEALVWDTRTGVRLAPPLRHGGWVHRGLFSSDGHEVLTRSADGTCRRWDATTGLPLGEPFVAGVAPVRPEVAAAPGGHWFATATSQPEVRLWHEPEWPSPAPEWLPELAAAAAGLRVEPSGVETPVPYAELQRWRSRFAAATGQDAWTRWAKWFLADRGTRTVAWDSDLTVPAYVESLVAEGTVEALRRALRYAPMNALVLAHLAQATLTDTNNPCRVKEADFLRRRAGELQPDSEGVKGLSEGMSNPKR